MKSGTTDWSPMRRILVYTAALAALSLAVGACAGNDDSGDKTATTDDGQKTATATPALDLATVDGVAIYESVSPAVPRVSTAAGTSAALLVEGGMLLTAADMVTPGGSVTVTFTDGTTLADVPVAAVDVATDTAVLGPVEVDVTPAAVADPESVAVGMELFMLGYGPGRERPAMGSVLLASEFDWAPGGFSFLEMDSPGIQLQGAAVVLDRSGRALALRVPTSSGVLAVPVALLTARAPAMIEHGSAARVLSSGKPLPVQSLILTAANPQRLLAFEAPAGAPTTIVVNSDAAVSLAVHDPRGTVIEDADVTPGEQLTLTLTPGKGGPRFAVLDLVDLAAPEGATVEVSADVDLALYVDPDDGAVLKAGDTFVGAIDYQGDMDVLFLDLVPGQTAIVQASSPRADPLLELKAMGDDPGLVDDDSGGGPFMTDALLQFKAATAGQHMLVISDALLSATGGYVVTFAGAASDKALAETIDQIRGLASSVVADPRGEEALRELLAGLIPEEEVTLPAAFGSAWRGTTQAGELITEVATTDTVEAGPGSARTVSDDDGRFTVRATILAHGRATAVLAVTDVNGEPAGAGSSGQVTADCPAEHACAATVSLDVVDAADLGPWTVSLAPLDGEIGAWQIEVLGDPAASSKPSLPPGQ